MKNPNRYRLWVLIFVFVTIFGIVMLIALLDYFLKGTP